VFTVFYIAMPERSEEIGDGSVDPDLTLDGVSEFELIELCKLLLNGRPHNPSLGFADEEQGLYVLVAEGDLIHALASLMPEEQSVVGQQWAASEGFARFSVGEVTDMLRDLVKLAVKSRETSESVVYLTAF
jgi:hypothetical protein